MATQYTILHSQLTETQTETLVAMAIYDGDSVDWARQAVESVLTQSYQSFVFFIVLDGEVTAKMVSMLKDIAYHDNRVVIAQNEKNSGLAASMNHAIEWGMALNPSYFVRMDADDESVVNRLERQISYLNKHKNIAVLGTGLTEVNERGRVVGARVMPASHRQIVHLLPRRCTLNHPTVVIRYQVFHDGHRYDNNLKNTQDYFLWVTLASHGYIFRNLKDRLLQFRRVNNFYKRRGIGKSLNEFRARLYAMRQLKRFTLFNLFYACGVLTLRMMPAKLVKLAYRIDRTVLARYLKH